MERRARERVYIVVGKLRRSTERGSEPTKATLLQSTQEVLGREEGGVCLVAQSKIDYRATTVAPPIVKGRATCGVRVYSYSYLAVVHSSSGTSCYYCQLSPQTAAASRLVDCFQ